MKFLLPVKVGDTVTCYGRLLKTGNSSISINLRVTAQGLESKQPQDVTNGTFIYVAIDLDGKPRQLPIRKSLYTVIHIKLNRMSCII